MPTHSVVHRTRTRTRLVSAVGAVVVTAVVMVGALAGGAAVPAGAFARAAKSSDTVTLLTHDSFAVSDDVLAAFTKQTGITVKVLQAGDAGQVLNQAILTADHPVADAIFGVDRAFLGRALDAPLLAPYRPADLDTVPADLRAGTRGRLTPIDVADVCINVDEPWFAAHRQKPPTTLESLTRPAFRDLLVVEDPSTSSPGLAFLLATVAAFGEQGWQDYWKRLRANGVKVVDGWEQAYEEEFSGSGTGGERPLVVSYATSPAAAVVFADPPITTSPIGTMTRSCFRDVEYAGVLRGAEHPRAAQRLVDFMLSEKFQADVPLQMFVYPARTGTPLPKVFTENVDEPTDPYTLPAATIDAHRDDWIREWTGIVLR